MLSRGQVRRKKPENFDVKRGRNSLRAFQVEAFADLSMELYKALYVTVPFEEMTWPQGRCSLLPERGFKPMKEFVKASLSMPSFLVLISALERLQKTAEFCSLGTVMSFNENFSDAFKRLWLICIIKSLVILLCR